MQEALQTTNPETQATQSFYYTVAGHNILLEPEIKTEIIEKQRVFPIPHAPSWCQGMISLRGKLIPVVNLHQTFNSHKQADSHWLLVLEKAPYPLLAISIDQLPMQQQLNDEPREDVNHEALPKWLLAAISIDEKTLYEANHTELFEQIIQENEQSKSDLQQH